MRPPSCPFFAGWTACPSQSSAQAAPRHLRRPQRRATSTACARGRSRSRAWDREDGSPWPRWPSTCPPPSSPRPARAPAAVPRHRARSLRTSAGVCARSRLRMHPPRRPTASVGMRAISTSCCVPPKVRTSGPAPDSSPVDTGPISYRAVRSPRLAPPSQAQPVVLAPPHRPFRLSTVCTS